MRIFQALMSPRGGLGLTLLAIAFGFVALMLDQADVKIPALIYVFGVLAVVSGLGALAAFFGPWDKTADTQELETQERWRGQDALNEYLNQMQQWLDNENRAL